MSGVYSHHTGYSKLFVVLEDKMKSQNFTEVLLYSHVMASFHPSSKDPSPVSWSAALHPKNFPASCIVGMKNSVLSVTFPSGLVWKYETE